MFGAQSDTRAAREGEALRFLRALTVGADELCDAPLVELRCFKGRRRGGAPRRWYSLAQLEAAARDGVRWGDEGWTVYVSAAPRLREGGEGEDVAGFCAVQLDVDWGPGKAFDSPAAVREALDALHPAMQPGMVVDSGSGGLHAYYLLREPLTPDEHPRFAILAARLRVVLPGDKVDDAARVMRLPGTFNHKPEVIAANGGPGLVRLLKCDASQRHDVAELEDELPELPPNASQRRAVVGAHPVELPADLSPRLQRVLKATEGAGWVWRLKRNADGKLSAVVLQSPCPACAEVNVPGREPPRGGTAHMAPVSGALRCKRAQCVAGDEATEGKGLALDAWVKRYAGDDCLPALAVAPAPRWTRDELQALRAEADGKLERAIRDAGARCEAHQAELQRIANEARGAELPIPPTLRGALAVIIAPTGLGKTREALRKLEREKRGTLLAESHDLLNEHREKIDAPKRLYRGIARERDEGGCKYPSAVKAWGKEGHSPRATLCKGCEHRDNYEDTGKPCPAYRGAEGRGVRVLTHAQASWVRGELTPVVFCDELPELLQTFTHDSDSAAAIVAQTQRPWGFADWAKQAEPLTRLVTVAGELAQYHRQEARKRGDDDAGYPRAWRGDELRELLTQAAHATGPTSLLPPEDDDGGRLADAAARFPLESPAFPAELARQARDGEVGPRDFPSPQSVEALQAIARFAQGDDDAGLALVADEKGWRVELRELGGGVFSLLAPEGNDAPHSVVLLDATGGAMLDAIRAAVPEGVEVSVSKVECPEDPEASRRYHVRHSKLTRRALFGRRGRRLTPRGGKLACRALRLAAGCVAHSRTAVGAVGIITHKPLADALRGGCKAPNEAEQAVRDELLALQRKWGCEVAVGHFGGVRGSNRFEACTHLIELGDPWSDVTTTQLDAGALGLAPDEHCRAVVQSALVQDFGRARAVRATPEAPKVVVHVGAVLAESWAAEAATIPVHSFEVDKGRKANEDVQGTVLEVLAEHDAVSVPLVVEYLQREGEGGSVVLANRKPSLLANTTEPENTPDPDYLRRRVQRSVAKVCEGLARTTTTNPEGTARIVWYEATPGAAATAREALATYSYTVEAPAPEGEVATESAPLQLPEASQDATPGPGVVLARTTTPPPLRGVWSAAIAGALLGATLAGPSAPASVRAAFRGYRLGWLHAT